MEGRHLLQKDFHDCHIAAWYFKLRDPFYRK